MHRCFTPNGQDITLDSPADLTHASTSVYCNYLQHLYHLNLLLGACKPFLLEKTAPCPLDFKVFVYRGCKLLCISQGVGICWFVSIQRTDCYLLPISDNLPLNSFNNHIHRSMHNFLALFPEYLMVAKHACFKQAFCHNSSSKAAHAFYPLFSTSIFEGILA